MTEERGILERAARALCAADGSSWKEPPYNRLHTDAGNNHWRFKAHAVIEALMEPTPEMLAAVQREITGYPRPEAVIATWQVLLRTALSQPNDEGEGK